MSELQVSRLWRYGPDRLNGSLILNNTTEPPEMPEECFKELKTSSKETHNLATTEVKPTIGYHVKGSAASGDYLESLHMLREQ